MNPSGKTQGSVRRLTEADLPLLLAWRNHPEVRRFMFASQEIAQTEHQAWFARQSADPARHLLLFELDGLARGFANIHLLNPAGGIADWGFYASPDAPRGTGQLLGKAVLEHVFEVLHLHKICAQVIAFNERSLRFHVRLGFAQEGALRDQHFDGQRHHDVICFGLLRSMWVDIRREEDGNTPLY